MKRITSREVRVVTIGGRMWRIEVPPYLAEDMWGGREYDQEYVMRGGPMPKYLRVAYNDICCRSLIFYPIPLNYLVRVFRSMRWKILKVFYWVGLIDVPPGEMFTWDNFFRIKTH